MIFTSKEEIDTPPICKSIVQKSSGNNEKYENYISDTKEAISLLQNDFMSARFGNYDDIVGWFHSKFNMYKSEENDIPFNLGDQVQGQQDLQTAQNTQMCASYYRSFLSLQNDVVFRLRVSNHYSPIDSMKRKDSEASYKPEYEYHILIDRIDIEYSNPKKKIVDGKSIARVRDVDVYGLKVSSYEIGNAKFFRRRKLVEPLVELLKTGDVPTENINVVKLSESVMDFERFVWCQSICEALNRICS